jgi:hypothetical protein
MLSLGITTGEYKACIKLNSQRRRNLGDINGKYTVFQVKKENSPTIVFLSYFGVARL